MRINRLILIQTVIAMSVALGVWYLQKRVGGPVGGIIPGVLGFCLGWFITPALLEDIDRVRGWLLRRRLGDGACSRSNLITPRRPERCVPVQGLCAGSRLISYRLSSHGNPDASPRSR